MTDQPSPDRKKTADAETREGRLAKALRDNLRRRKIAKKPVKDD